MNRIEVDVMTGQVLAVPYTAEELAEIAARPPAPPIVYTVYKAEIWRRATNDEAVTIDAALNAQPVRLQRMWSDAAFLRSDDEYFTIIQAALTNMFGAARTAELLSPTTE